MNQTLDKRVYFPRVLVASRWLRGALYESRQRKSTRRISLLVSVLGIIILSTGFAAAGDLRWTSHVPADSTDVTIWEIHWKRSSDIPDWYYQVKIFEGRWDHFNGFFVEKSDRYYFFRGVDGKSLKLEIGNSQSQLQLTIVLNEAGSATIRETITVEPGDKEAYFELRLRPYRQNGLEVSLVDKGVVSIDGQKTYNKCVDAD